MTGVYTAVYILTVSCFGPGCEPMPKIQELVTQSQQGCEAIAGLLRQRGPDRIIDATCRGEAREVDYHGIRLGSPTE